MISCLRKVNFTFIKRIGDRLFEKQFGGYAQGEGNQSRRTGACYGGIPPNYNFFGEREIQSLNNPSLQAGRLFWYKYREHFYLSRRMSIMKGEIKYKILIPLGIIAYVASFVTSKYELDTFTGGLRGFGIIVVILSILKMNSERDRIDDTDERNVAIRGKAAYISSLITMAALVVCICYYLEIEEEITTLVFCVVFLIQNISMGVATAIYKRKM